MEGEGADPRNSLRRVDFREAGEGVYLHLKNSKIKILFAQHGQNYFQIIELGLTLLDMNIIEQMLDMCAMKNDAPHKVELDDLDAMTMEQLQTKLLDAFSLAGNGRLFKEQIEFMKEEGRRLAAAGKEKEDPPTSGPAGTSETSSEELTGPDSNPPNSTI